MTEERIKRRDAFKRGFVFRSAITGRFVSRLHALLFPRETTKERVDR